MRYKDTDYLHAAARVTYLETQLITREDLVKAVDAPNVKEVYRLLSGKSLRKNDGEEEYEKSFEADLAETYHLMEDITGDIGLTDIFRYPIDGHNMKVHVKGKLAEGDVSHLYKNGGTIDWQIMIQEIDDKKFVTTPWELGEAALEAIDTLAKTEDPQMVDVIIDKAILKAMGERAEEIGAPVLLEYTKARIDLINIKSALRLLQMKKDTYAAGEIFARGGSLSVADLTIAYGMGYDGLKKLAKEIPGSEHVESAIGRIKSGESIGLMDRVEDRYFREIFERTKIIPFGIEPIIHYLYQKEREVRASRLVITSKMFGLPKNDILERLRLIYGD